MRSSAAVFSEDLTDKDPNETVPQLFERTSSPAQRNQVRHLVIPKDIEKYQAWLASMQLSTLFFFMFLCHEEQGSPAINTKHDQFKDIFKDLKIPDKKSSFSFQLLVEHIASLNDALKPHAIEMLMMNKHFMNPESFIDYQRHPVIMSFSKQYPDSVKNGLAKNAFKLNAIKIMH